VLACWALTSVAAAYWGCDDEGSIQLLRKAQAHPSMNLKIVETSAMSCGKRALCLPAILFRAAFCSSVQSVSRALRLYTSAFQTASAPSCVSCASSSERLLNRALDLLVWCAPSDALLWDPQNSRSRGTRARRCLCPGLAAMLREPERASHARLADGPGKPQPDNATCLPRSYLALPVGGTPCAPRQPR
jgi:hypothetical protein